MVDLCQMWGAKRANTISITALNRKTFLTEIIGCFAISCHFSPFSKLCGSHMDVYAQFAITDIRQRELNIFVWFLKKNVLGKQFLGDSQRFM